MLQRWVVALPKLVALPATLSSQDAGVHSEISAAVRRTIFFADNRQLATDN